MDDERIEIFCMSIKDLFYILTTLDLSKAELIASKFARKESHKIDRILAKVVVFCAKISLFIVCKDCLLFSFFYSLLVLLARNSIVQREYIFALKSSILLVLF